MPLAPTWRERIAPEADAISISCISRARWPQMSHAPTDTERHMTTDLSDRATTDPAAELDPTATSDLKSLLAEAEDIETPPERLLVLAGMHPRLAVATAGNAATPASRLRTLARSQRISIRAAIAGNPNADLDTLKVCIPASPGRFLANPALPFLLLENPNLLQQLPYNAFRAIVLHPAVPQPLLASLIAESLRSPEERRGGLLLARPDLRADHAHALSRSILPCDNGRLLTHVACVKGNDADVLPTIVRLAMRRSTLEARCPPSGCWPELERCPCGCLRKSSPWRAPTCSRPSPPMCTRRRICSSAWPTSRSPR